MQRLMHFSPGKALCRFCGDQVPMNNLSTHIASKHPRPRRTDTAPVLVRKLAVAAGSRSK